MIFERELSLEEPIQQEIFDALGRFLRTTPKSSSFITQQHDQLLLNNLFFATDQTISNNYQAVNVLSTKKRQQSTSMNPPYS